MGKTRIGISGWRYPPWRGRFYPEGLPQRYELAYASRRMDSIELNGSFYSLQRPDSYARWYRQTPHDFVFAVKGPRFITHMRRLRDVEVPLANFLASGVLDLRHKLGPLLWQLPPNFHYGEERLDAFLKLLPRNVEQAARLAARHDSHLKHPAPYLRHTTRRLRHAIEVRHESFVDPSFIALLRRHGVALVLADTAGRWPWQEDLTAGFVYLRLHGDKELYASGYGDAALKRWETRIRAWRAGGQARGSELTSSAAPPRRQSRDVYCYFDNDAKVKAPFDAMALRALLGQ